MNDLPIRVVTAVAPYDGHDASTLALNDALMRAPFPVEILYLGFNMGAEKIVRAALQEGADALAVSSYNGGHLQFFPYLLELLAANNRADLLCFGGGGGTISRTDRALLEEGGISRVYGPEVSLDEAASDILKKTAAGRLGGNSSATKGYNPLLRALAVSFGHDSLPVKPKAQVVFFSGDGGAGKSTVIDELIRRFLEHFPKLRLAVLANDPTIISGGKISSFLADRVRMNAIYDDRVLFHSVASGAPYLPLNPDLGRMLESLRQTGVDLIFVETPGSGQSGMELEKFRAKCLVHIKTKEYGSALQLSKEQLLYDADLVVLNKLDLEGAEMAYGELYEHLSGRGRAASLHGVVAKLHNDPGMDRLFASLGAALGLGLSSKSNLPCDIFAYAKENSLVPYERRGYLGDIVSRVRQYEEFTAEQLDIVRHHPDDTSRLAKEARQLLESWPAKWQELLQGAAHRLGIETDSRSLNGLTFPRVALPDPEDRLESLRFLLEDGLPGTFPFASGIHPLRRRSAGETSRQFAGFRGPEETNRRLHLLNRQVERPRLSIAFDGITLYGDDSDSDPGSRGKIGEGGVAIDTFEDMKILLKGFDLRVVSTSMTINGPAPVILAMYFVAALELEAERLADEKGRSLTAAEEKEMEAGLFAKLAGTVQADILKEVQAQNEALFQTEFAMRLLGDVQEYFVENGIKKFYSLSISGYHMGEAGATPVQELAFTLANGFTYVEYFLGRGMGVDDFAANLSFFFRVSHEIEWLAYGAVCRRIWAIAMRERYGANSTGQRLKFHTQTSGRALQAAEWDIINPLRQSYHALMALLAGSDSLHVDSADEPMTTPGERYVRQAAMIPRYLREESEAFVVENLLSGSYAFRAVGREMQRGILREFSRLDQLGGVGPATERGYQRAAIAKSSREYEKSRRPKASSQGPRRLIVGYNAYTLDNDDPHKYPEAPELVRAMPEDAARQIARLKAFREEHRLEAPKALGRLESVARGSGNTFAELLNTVRYATLGEICRTLEKAGGRFRKMV